MKKEEVAVLMGGWSGEREVSLRSGRAVLRALKILGIKSQGIVVNGIHSLKPLFQRKYSAVVLALHGPFGEDGSIQGILDILGVPYTGSGVAASALAMNKAAAKQAFQRAHVPTPRWRDLRHIASPKIPFHLPVVVKPSGQGSALGVTIVKKKTHFKKALKTAFHFGPDILVEEFIDGRELTVGVLDATPLPVIEIVPKRGFYDYTAKYKKGMSKHLLPAPLAPAQTSLARALAVKACLALGCRGASRVDMILDRRGRFFVLEVNTIPGMTKTSLLPEAAKAAGLSFPELVRRMLWMAKQNQNREKRRKG